MARRILMGKKNGKDAEFDLVEEILNYVVPYCENFSVTPKEAEYLRSTINDLIDMSERRE